MATLKLTETQVETLRKLEQHGGRLVRLRGGFWTTPDAKVSGAGVPEWWIGVQTVRALERRGLLVRANEFSESWRDPRVLPPVLRCTVPGCTEEKEGRCDACNELRCSEHAGRAGSVDDAVFVCRVADYTTGETYCKEGN